MKNPPFISKEELEKLYRDHSSIHKVGSILSKSGDTISRWLKYYNIQILNDPKRYNKYRTPLTNKVKDLVIGSMLGDGNLHKQRSCRLRFCHGSKQLDYLKWKKNILGDLVQQDIFKYKQKTRNSTEYLIQTITHPEFSYYYNLFYKNKIKIIPDNISTLLNDFSLAVWLMDDGWKHPNQRSIVFCTDSFSLEENELLIESLKKFNIDSTLRKNNKYHRIYIGNKNVETLSEIVRPWVIPSMKHKITVT